MQTEEVGSSSRVFEGKMFSVRVDKVRLPSGLRVSREVVDHTPSVVIVPIDADGNVLLVRQYRYAVGRALLEAPAGSLEGSEAPDEGAQRELQEEIGYIAKDLRSLGSFWVSPGYCTEFMHAYLGKDLVPSRLDPDEDENIIVERLPLARAASMIRDGEIKDAKTITALLLARSLS